MPLFCTASSGDPNNPNCSSKDGKASVDPRGRAHWLLLHGIAEAAIGEPNLFGGDTHSSDTSKNPERKGKGAPLRGTGTTRLFVGRHGLSAQPVLASFDQLCGANAMLPSVEIARQETLLQDIVGMRSTTSLHSQVLESQKRANNDHDDLIKSCFDELNTLWNVQV